TSPYAHPILPLLLDSDSAREAMPQAALPQRLQAPEDARQQVEDALALVERELGSRPRGMWPSEGSLSREAAELLAACGIDWTASDEQLLAASETNRPVDTGRPWTQAGAAGPALVFRDHELSDRIGFSYARADPGQAAEDFLSGVLQRAQPGGEGPRLLLVALDGENPWEHYPRAGGPFLRALYGGLGRHAAIDCETVAGAVARSPERGRLDRLRAGSWIHADFGTWIGGPQKNRAWELLGEVRSLLQEASRDARTPEPAKSAAWASLRAAQGSDWFWWLDGQFTTEYRAAFDQTFRGHLRQACEALGQRPPRSLGLSMIPSEKGDDLTESGA
ncbi:MAG TPA: glycoside hydrolase family 57 protein, partial [Candidatus Polarisedimenticolia bacterium]|nr:glycoside hydrolase family 57 protein [Candidatus Polarisedimenticolia bacterium]